MDTNFWHQRWQANEIGFHEGKVNSLLATNLTALDLVKGNRLFLPLCGKTQDIAWLLEQGYQVAGVELSQLAIEQLFDALKIQPVVTTTNNFIHYKATNIDLFVGDIFELNHQTLGGVNAVFDRAALVALPETMRIRYSEHVIRITKKAPQLLITFEYNQALMQGPPFSITSEEIRLHYDNTYEITSIASIEVTGGLKGQCAAKEVAWLLKPL